MDTGALRRRGIARQLLRVFLLAGLLPLAVLAALAYRGVTSELRAQAEGRLHHASKTAGMAVLRRLLDLEDALRGADGSAADALRGLSSSLRVCVAGPAALDLSGRRSPEASRLREGSSLLLALPAERSSRLVLVLPGRDGRAPLAVELAPGGLLAAAAEVAPVTATVCLAHANGQVAGCAGAAPELLAVDGVAPTLAPGPFQIDREDERYLADLWLLPLRPSFGADNLLVVAAEPSSEVFRPIAEFRVVFPLTVALVFLVVVMLVSHQIRRRLVPLRQLQDLARALGRGQFDVSARIASGDEFEELGASFDQMAGRLKRHFGTLERLVAIDRAMLSATDERALVETVLRQAREVYTSDAVAVLLRDRDVALQLSTLRPGDGAAVAHLLDPLSRADEDRLLASGGLELGAGDALLRSLGPLGARAARALALPLVANGELLGALAFGLEEGRPFDEGRESYARRLAGQLAIALSNLRTRERNRVLAWFDPLTGLPNRVLGAEHLRRAIQRGSREGGVVGICVIDLDGFKALNDTLGHEAGDELLRQVAERLSKGRPEGAVARLGGDEFSLLVADVSTEDDVDDAVRRALAELERPVSVRGRELYPTASCGVALHPADGVGPEALLRCADSALSHAKAQGRRQRRFFNASMNASALERLSLESELRRAVEREEFRLAFQPIVDVETREVVGAEALLRWERADGMPVEPSSFIPRLEETGLIVPVGDWVLRRACRAARAWQRHEPDLHVAVNLSVRQILDGRIAATVRSALEESGLDPRCLHLEITESLFVERGDAVSETLAELRGLGVRLCIDDFGTGYSALGYLSRLRVDVLKIDQSFVRALTTDPHGATIPEAIIAMAHGLSLQVIAEGVETEGQLALLRAGGCDLAQGYLFDAPLAPDDFEKRIRRR